MAENTYHHGNLREAVLRRAAEVIRNDGVDAVSLRALAADVGVSHAAPRHHFGSRAGLLAALAAEGFDLLTLALQDVQQAGAPAVELGVAYVRFAQAHPAHFVVMFGPEAAHLDDPVATTARRRALEQITLGIAPVADAHTREQLATAVLAGWAMMHGLVALHTSGALTAAAGGLALPVDDLERVARATAALLYRPGPE